MRQVVQHLKHSVRGSALGGSLVCFLTLPAQGGPADDAIAALFETHLRICGPALQNAQTFVDGLAAVYPSGTAAISTTPDGQLFRVSISEKGGRFNTQFSRYIIGAMGRENCATYYTDLMFDVETSVMAGAFEQFVTARYGAGSLRGGRMPQYYGDATMNSDILQEDVDAFEYLVNGVHPFTNVLTISAVQGGSASLVTERGISAQ